MRIECGVRGWSGSVLGVLLVAVAAAGGLAVGCSSSSKPPPTIQCILASDCKDLTKQCVQGYCVGMCTTSQDCPSSQRCVKYAPATAAGGAAGDTGGAGGMSVAVVPVASGNICQVPEIKTCALNSDCTPGLFCAKDLQCRNMCNADVDCLGGVSSQSPARCTVSHYCIDPVADASNYDPITNDFKPNVGAGGASGTGGTGGGGGKGGAGGQAMTTCTTPQTAFITPVEGTTNANFTSGVAARVADRLLIFTAYSGPILTLPGAAGASGAGDTGGAGGAAPTGNYIFAQAFNPATGASLGAAAPLFKIADGTNLYLHNVAVSSAGEVALLHGTGPANGDNTQLYVSFLSSAGGTLQLESTTTIESAQFGDVNALWSESTAQFVFSWKNATNGWIIRTKKFRPGGAPAGGDTNSVMTQTGLNGTDFSFGLGVSGQLFGVVYRDYSTALPYLTLLDATGNVVGTPVQLAMMGIDRWATVGGTSMGFSVLYQRGSTLFGTFIPKTADGLGIQFPSGAGGAGGAGGASGAWTMFSSTSTDTSPARAFTISDQLGAQGVGTVYLETNGASFLYVTADGTKNYPMGTVISTPTGTQAAITNYRGSFSVSVFDGTLHAVWATNSFCTD